MTEHLTRAIADKLYFAFGRLHCFEDSLSNLKHTAVVLGAYVDYLSPDLVDIRVQQLVQPLEKRGTIDFRGRNVDKAFDCFPVLDDRVGNCLRTKDVGFKEKPVIVNRARYV